jgi:hypothetical protein
LNNSIIEKITSIIGNKQLSKALYQSISVGLNSSMAQLTSGNSVWDIFDHSLKESIRDIEAHPRGKIFRRLIEYGSYQQDEPEIISSDNKTTLTDRECEKCIEFIYSSMVNRFKGELAELLAIESCITHIKELCQNEILPSDITLFWGDTIKEGRRIKLNSIDNGPKWSGFTKGADGLIVQQMAISNKSNDNMNIVGIVEVKSMTRSKKEILAQINRHINRLHGGIMLGEKEWTHKNLKYNLNNSTNRSKSDLIRLIIIPSNWKLNREWQSVKTGKKRKLLFHESYNPQFPTKFENLEPDLWKITLAWSKEALNQAAYEMTFWYMSQVGLQVYNKKSMPKGWEGMTPEQAGYNSIKMHLYYIPLRKVNNRCVSLAIKLYNVYCFGYPLGAYSKEMLWPEDFPEEDESDH